MNESSSVIIYRSKFEQQQDEYWSDFAANNPVVVNGVGIVFFVCVAGFIFIVLSRVAMDFLKK